MVVSLSQRRAELGSLLEVVEHNTVQSFKMQDPIGSAVDRWFLAREQRQKGKGKEREDLNDGLDEVIEKLRFSPGSFPVVSLLSSSQTSTIHLVSYPTSLGASSGETLSSITTLPKIYVLKTLLPTSSSPPLPLIEREVHTLASLTQTQHAPHLLCSFLSSPGNGEGGISRSLLLDYIPNGTLEDLLASLPDGIVADEECVKYWLGGVADALEWLGSVGGGYVHRDLKPSNLLLSLHPEPHLLITDFGSCAPLLPAGSSTSSRSISPELCLFPAGTPDYISPEVLICWESGMVEEEEEDASNSEDVNGSIRKRHDGPFSYGPEVDIWSFGIILYEMLYGTPAFYANSIRETYGKILNHETSLKFPLEAAISSNTKNIITSLLSSPSTRPRVSELKELLAPPTSPPGDIFVPSPPEISIIHDKVGLSSLGFSRFFEASSTSSPGLEILRMSHRRSEVNGDIYQGFSWGPEENAFKKEVKYWDQDLPSPLRDFLLYGPPKNHMSGVSLGNWDDPSRFFGNPAFNNAFDYTSNIQHPLHSPPPSAKTTSYETPLRPINRKSLPPPSTARRIRPDVPQGTGLGELIECVRGSVKTRVYLNSIKRGSGPQGKFSSRHSKDYPTPTPSSRSSSRMGVGLSKSFSDRLTEAESEEGTVAADFKSQDGGDEQLADLSGRVKGLMDDLDNVDDRLGELRVWANN